MTAVNSGLSPAQVQASIVAKLKAHRDALNDINNLFTWASGLAVSDMEAAAGLNASDAQAYMSAIFDAHAEYSFHVTGLPPNTYPQPGSSYPYGASQAQVIGPQ